MLLQLEKGLELKCEEMQMEVYRQLEFDLQSLRMIKNRLETAFFSGLSEDQKYVWFFNKKEIISSFTLSNGML